MNLDEFAFFNQQLSAMVRDGIPLESALRRLCSDMHRGRLRTELVTLETNLAKGTPLPEAVAARQLPALYRQMLEVGAQSNNLPAVLTMLADHYQRRHILWTRLKGLLVYPVMVLVGAFLLSCLLAVLMNKLLIEFAPDFRRMVFDTQIHPEARVDYSVAIWAGPILLGLAAAAVLTVIVAPKLRERLRWRLPAFREASLAQLASVFALMLKNGVSLDRALSLIEKLESGSPVVSEMVLWRQRLASGLGKFSEMAAESRLVPPLFIWTVSQAYEDMPTGFQRAADSYQARAGYRTETLLYAVLPCSVMLLGLVIITQLLPILAVFGSLFRLFDVDF